MPIYGYGRGAEPDEGRGPETRSKVRSMDWGFWSGIISKLTFSKNEVHLKLHWTISSGHS